MGVSAPVQTGLGGHPASCTMGTGSSPGVKSGRGVTLTPHHLLVPWSWKSRAIPLLPLWAVRPVQSLSACTRVHFTFLPIRFHVGTSKTSLEQSVNLYTKMMAKHISQNRVSDRCNNFRSHWCEVCNNQAAICASCVSVNGYTVSYSSIYK